MITYIDFETQSAAPLRKVGAYNYAAHPTTRALCMAYAIDNGPVEIWTAASGKDFPVKLFTRGVLVAHNVTFERNILKECFKLDIPLERWIDTAALARHGGMPVSYTHLTLPTKRIV